MAYLHNLPAASRAVHQANERIRRQNLADSAVDFHRAIAQERAEAAARIQNAKKYDQAYHVGRGFVRIAEDV